MDLDACLPTRLRGATITRIAAGLSGAGVYRVGDAHVLKVSTDGETEWRHKLDILRLAAGAGLAPAIVHVDDAHRAVLSELVVDRSFTAYVMRSRDDALATLGRTLRRVHELPLPAGVPHRDVRGLLARIWASLASFPMPGFVGDAARRVLDDAPPPSDRPLVLSHNDVNPSNIVYDGDRVVLLDWDNAGANDPFFDLAAVSVFFRLGDAAGLLAAYGAVADARFTYNRRLVAAACGVIFLHLARLAGHAGGDAALDAAPSLADVHQGMRTGALNVGSADGQWAFGLALAKESLAV
jgi:aminoglycoside phosphotransferase